MTEANPPAQPEELRRRILLLVAEPHRRPEPPYHDEIAEELNEAEDAIRDQLRILDHRGFVFLQTALDTLIPTITPQGLLEVEKIAQEAPQPDSPPSSEPQEFEHSPDYATVIWRGREFHFSPMQSHAVRLLHEEFQAGRNNLRDANVIEDIEAKVRTLHDLFKRPCGVWGKLIIKGERQGTHRLNLSRQVPPDSN